MQRLNRIYLIGMVSVCFIFSVHTLSLAQGEEPVEDIQLEAEEETTMPGVTGSEPVGLESQWLWGEVVSVDTKLGQIKIMYIDYETDTEKEIIISTSDKTTYENVSGLGQIKPKDTLSVEYTAKDNKNLAQHITVEQIESLPEKEIAQ